MNQKLNKILLVDDSEPDNFLTSRIVKKADVCNEIVVTYGGEEALRYLAKPEDGKYPNPELIFLDINMPGMNGWEFLEAYNELPETMRKGIVVCMLSTSFAEVDLRRTEDSPVPSDHFQKPLTADKLHSVIERYYPEYVKRQPEE